jgi:adenylate kinase family enzyme
MPAKPEVIFVLGGPGSGKGTHCTLMKEHYDLIHYSVGDILRSQLASGSSEAQEISRLMKEGKMVPSDFVVKGIKDTILKGNCSKLILLDGFPRSQDNIDAWNRVVGDDISVVFLMYIDVSDEEMRRRLLNRGKTSGRLDDNP